MVIARMEEKNKINEGEAYPGIVNGTSQQLEESLTKALESLQNIHDINQSALRQTKESIPKLVGEFKTALDAVGIPNGSIHSDAKLFGRT